MSSRWAKLANDAIAEMKPPPTVKRKHKHVPKKISTMKREAVMARWDSVREEVEQWLQPFYSLTIERAMAYLEDLRKICTRAGAIMNQRIGNDPNKVRCAGPRCGKDLSGTLSNGRPRWIAKKDFRDKEHPEIIHSIYFCSELCNNAWTRATQGAGGTTGQ